MQFPACMVLVLTSGYTGNWVLCGSDFKVWI